MNAARFMAGVIAASDVDAADLRICNREAHQAACVLHPLKGEERELARAEYRKISAHRTRVAERNGVEPF